MKALRLVEGSTDSLVIQEVETPETEVGYALVKIKAAALNRRDYWITKGKYPGIKFDRTLGSDGCGIVEMVGKEADRGWIGKEVLINPNINWGDDERCQSKDYRILGMPDHGTFAEQIVVPIDRLKEKPEHLDYAQSAALPLAGLTAYRAVFTHAEVSKGAVVLISGFGGGVAQFAFQFSVQVGAEVFVTTSSQEKLDKAISLGAKGGVNYQEDGWSKKLLEISGGFTHVIDSAGGDQVNDILKIMKPAGRYVFYGATLGLPKNIDMYRVFYNQIRLQGSTMGNDQEFSDMIDFVSKYKIKPVIDSIIPFSDALSAFERMEKGEQTGKLVLTFENKNQVGRKLQESVSKIKGFIKRVWEK